MKKLLFILLLACTASAAQAQFPTKDSLVKFINKWIRNSAVDAFTNLRLNTALLGMVSQADSLGIKKVEVSGTTLRIITVGKDTFAVTLPGGGGGGTFTIAKNGIRSFADSIKLGGILTENTQIRTVNKKYSGPFRYLSISNTDSADDYYYSGLGTAPGDTIYDRANLYVSRGFGDSAIAQRQYGGAAQFQTRNTFNTTNKAFLSSSSPYFWPYGGAYSISQLFPPDTAYIRSSPYGATGSAFAGDFGIGQSSKYRIDVVSSTNIPYYPLAVYRSGIDYARSSDAFKREVYGNGMVNFLADWRSHQGTINSGTTEYGSYVQRHVGFMGYGTIIPHTSSPSKAKTLAVSTVDTFAHFWARPAYTDFNEVKNGYGYVQEGTKDYNWYQGFTKLGGTMPGTATAQTHQVHIDSTLMVGKPYTSTSYMTLYNSQTGVTSMTGKYIRGLAALNEYVFDANTSIATSFMAAGDFRLALSAGSAQNTASNNSGVGANALVGRVLLRKKAGYTGTTTFEGGTTVNTSLAAIAATFDISGASTVGNENIGTGWFSAIRADVLLSSYNNLKNFVWLQTGGGQLNSLNSGIDTGYQIYMRPHNTTTIGVKYALYQAGAADTNWLAGPTRLVNLTTGTNTDSILVKNNGVIKAVAPSAFGGGGLNSSQVAAQIHDSLTANALTLDNANLGDTLMRQISPSQVQWKGLIAGAGIGRVVTDSTIRDSVVLTTNRIGVGVNGALGSYSSYQYNGTQVTQENAAPVHLISSTTTPSSTSGPALKLFSRDLPTASGHLLGSLEYGTRDGSTNDNVVAAIRAFSTQAFTAGSAEGTDLAFLTSTGGTMSEQMRIRGNGRFGVGTNAPAGSIGIRANSTGTPQINLTGGGALTTTPLAGSIEYIDDNFYQTNSTAVRGVLEKTRVNVSSAGTLTISNLYSDWVFSGTTTTWTLPAVSGNTNVKIYIKNRGSGNITLNSNAGGNDIYNTSAVNTFSITPGQAFILVNDGTYWLVE